MRMAARQVLAVFSWRVAVLRKRLSLLKDRSTERLGEPQPDPGPAVEAVADRRRRPVALRPGAATARSGSAGDRRHAPAARPGDCGEAVRLMEAGVVGVVHHVTQGDVCGALALDVEEVSVDGCGEDGQSGSSVGHQFSGELHGNKPRIVMGNIRGSCHQSPYTRSQDLWTEILRGVGCTAPLAVGDARRRWC